MRADSQKINIIIDRPQKSPRFYQLNKRTLKFLFVGIPFTTIVLITGFYLFASYFKAMYQDIKDNEPVMVRKLKDKIKEINKEKEALIANEQKLLAKIEKGASFTQAAITQLIQTPLGMNNKIGHKICDIEEVEMKNQTIHFKIANKVEEKLRGYFFLFHYQNNMVKVYPTGNFKNSFKLKYTDGDIFGISRFKKMSINLGQFKKGDILYSVIFSKDGDLIYSKPIYGVQN